MKAQGIGSHPRGPKSQDVRLAVRPRRLGGRWQQFKVPVAHTSIKHLKVMCGILKTFPMLRRFTSEAPVKDFESQKL